MLKIKDNVDLKELEKYGFLFCLGYNNHNFYAKSSIKNTELVYKVDVRYRTMSVATYDGDEIDLDDTLYNLIKDGLVEKVED